MFILICLIQPYSEHGRIMISVHTVYRACLLSYLAIWWKWSNYDIGPYGLQGMVRLICLIQPYGGNGRIMILVPMVYRAC